MSRAASTLAALVLVLLGLAPAATARAVPSLQPQATQRQWHALVAEHRRRPAAAADCRTLNAVFYTATDWLRLATKLAASPSPCAQYTISVPPLAADKTAFRRDQGWRIDALGPQFHAAAEINYTGWSRWVAAGNGGWFDAGVQARRNMARDNFDVNRGDVWAVNEASSAVRAGTGNARQNLRDFLRGLYTGDGGPPVRGILFVVGPSQVGTDAATYQSNVEGWLQDSSFWSEISSYVSDFSQEVYGDVRAYAVAGAPAQQRRDYLEDWLGHPLLLANVAPDAGVPARTFLQQAYSPLANAAWPWASAFGYTDVPFDLMQQYVSAQAYAARALDVSLGLPQDRFGFAWSPRDDGRLAPSDFAAQSGALLDRLAAAIRDSGESVDPNDPGVGACGPPGQNLECGGDLPGAAFTDTWHAFRAWLPAASAFTGAPSSAVAGAAVGPLTVQLVTGTAANTAGADVAVSLSSTSTTGSFATAPGGPWTPTLSLTVAAGSSATPSFWYRDTHAGSATLRAVVAGRADGLLTVGVRAAPLRRLTIAPRTAHLRLHGRRVFVASATDALGNPAHGPITWRVGSAKVGRVSAHRGARTTFVARGRGRTVVVASVGGVSKRVVVKVS